MIQSSRATRSERDPLQVYCLDDGSDAICELARCWKLPVTTESAGRVVLTYQDRRLVLMDRRSRFVRPLWVELGVNAKNLPGKKDLLLRALGRKCRVVVDATAGWGVDTAGLLHHGYKVWLLERHPVMLALLEDGMGRLGPVQQRAVRLFRGNAIALLPELEARCGQVDVVYLDTMYPITGRSSALPRRELVLLRELVGDDQDAVQLLYVARGVARQRVVVKRPHYAPSLGDVNPDISYRSKLLRYDVYL